MSLTVRRFGRIGELSRAAWDAVVGPDVTPFARWAWLGALEASGCVSPAHGWVPEHLTLWRGGTLVAAAPAYWKEDSDGDFSRDWGFAEAAHRAGIPYYPKL